jgi:hypothetical protein
MYNMAGDVLISKWVARRLGRFWRLIDHEIILFRFSAGFAGIARLGAEQ